MLGQMADHIVQRKAVIVDNSAYRKLCGGDCVARWYSHATPAKKPIARRTQALAVCKNITGFQNPIPTAGRGRSRKVTNPTKRQNSNAQSNPTPMLFSQIIGCRTSALSVNER
jgi:hypothetical protein